MTRASDFKLLDRKAVDALLAMPERNLFFRALSSWIGYRTTQVEFDVRERTEGESKVRDFRHIRVRIRVVADGVAFLCHTFYKIRLRLKIIADEEERCLYAVLFERVQNSLRVAVFKAGIKRDVDLFLFASSKFLKYSCEAFATGGAPSL